MPAFTETVQLLKSEARTWLITGVAGFIGSNLLEALLRLDQRVIGLDNFSTGTLKNLDEVKTLVSTEQWDRFRFISGDIRDLQSCHDACLGVDFVLHQAALGSVPRSLEDPITTNSANVTGFLNMLVAARDARVQRFVYAASSSTYGDHPKLPKVEELIGKPLSPYAVTKYVNELYADVFSRAYGVECIGLRYFNVFGPRQDPNGAYAAVVPKWSAAMIRGEPIFINGDGKTSRDFCFIENALQANILAATTTQPDAVNEVFNVAVGKQTSLLALFNHIKKALASNGIHYNADPIYREFRQGDVRHSLACIAKARNRLGYSPSHGVELGIELAMPWYIRDTHVTRS